MQRPHAGPPHRSPPVPAAAAAGCSGAGAQGARARCFFCRRRSAGPPARGRGYPLCRPPAAVFWKKVAGLGVIFMGATICYTILQNSRDALIVTSCGAEALPFINGFLVLPASLCFFLYYDKLITRFHKNPDAIFYCALAPLAAFFALFGAFLLPNAHTLHPSAQAAALAAALPDSLGCLVRVVGNWSYTLFFVLGETWGSVAISLLFWSLADDVCTVDEAKTLYPKLGIAANLGLVMAGAFTRTVNGGVAKGDPVLSLQLQCAAVVVMAAVMCIAKRFIDRQVRPYLPATGGSKKEAKKAKKEQQKKEAGGEGEKPDTWAILRSSPRIRDIALMVMGFGITNKLFGWSWKAAMGQLYPNPNDFATVMADVASWTGIVTIALMAVSKWTFQLLGFKGAALATPTVMGLCGGIFFAGTVAARTVAGAGDVAVIGAVTAALITAGPVFGVVNQVFGRASKYSLFDPCKEMLFISMADKREKESGKAAVDLVGNQVGKTGGAWVMQGLVLATGSMAAATPFTAVVFLGVIGVWGGAAMRLARTMAPEERAVVLKTVEEAPALEPPMPQKVDPKKRAAAAAAAAAATAAAAAAPTNGAAAAAAPAAPAAQPSVVATAAPPSSNGNGNGVAAAGAAAATAAAAAAVAPVSDLEVHVDDDDEEEEEVKGPLQSHFD